MQMEVKTIEPISKYIKEFNTVDEFNLWYAKNKAEVDALTTHKLNKMYYVHGYHITKIKGVLMLKKYDAKRQKRYFSERDENEAIHELRVEIEADISNLTEKVDTLTTQIKDIKDTINGIIKFISADEPLTTP